MFALEKIFTVIFLVISVSTFFVQDAWGAKKGIPVNVKSFVDQVIGDIEKPDGKKLQEAIDNIKGSVVEAIKEWQSSASSKPHTNKINKFAKNFSDKIGKKIVSLEDKKDKYVAFFNHEENFNSYWDLRGSKEIKKKVTRSIRNFDFLYRAPVETTWLGSGQGSVMTFQEWVECFIYIASDKSQTIALKYDAVKKNFLGTKTLIESLKLKISSSADFDLKNIEVLLNQIKDSKVELMPQKSALNELVAQVIDKAAPNINVGDLIKKIDGIVSGSFSTSENFGKVVSVLLTKASISHEDLTSMIVIFKKMQNKSVGGFLAQVVNKAKEFKDITFDKWSNFINEVNALALMKPEIDKIKKATSDLFVHLSTQITELKDPLSDSDKKLMTKVWDGVSDLLEKNLDPAVKEKLLASKKVMAEKYVPVLSERLKKAVEEGDTDIIEEIAGKLKTFLGIPDIGGGVKNQIGELIEYALENSDDPEALLKLDFKDFAKLQKIQVAQKDPLSIKLLVLGSKLKKLKAQVAKLAIGLQNVADRLTPLGEKLVELKQSVSDDDDDT